MLNPVSVAIDADQFVSPLGTQFLLPSKLISLSFHLLSHIISYVDPFDDVQSHNENHENHVNLKHPDGNHENHESLRNSCEKHENHENHRSPRENHEKK